MGLVGNSAKTKKQVVNDLPDCPKEGNFYRKTALIIEDYTGKEGRRMQLFLEKYLPELLLTAACALFGAMYRALRRELAGRQTEREAIRSLLRSELITMHGRYVPRGAVPLYARENVQAMYHAYHALGGNGAVARLMEEIMALPTQNN